MSASASSVSLSSFNPKSLPLCVSRSASVLPPSLSFKLHSLSFSAVKCSSSPAQSPSRFVTHVAVSSDFEVEEDDMFADDDSPPQERSSFSADLKLFVGNLSFDVDSAQLAQLFESAGTVEMVEVIYDKVTGRSRGFGFVTMSTAAEVEAAAQQFNGYEFEGRPLRVNAGPPPPKREESFSRGPRSGGSGSGSSDRVYVGNLSWGVDDMALESLFSEQGKVVEARVIYDRDTGRSKGFGFVTLGSPQEVTRAISSLNGADLDGRQIRVSEAEARPPRRQF
ncbi:BnaA07g37730D [Brassica napus]|uniref:BnaA07g37730D protein n=1 Tax=Brassica napus TaxID=3708 RepID=A0A078IUR1_BRANA|nr:BnaA07g37730D [Brassica napus]